MSKQDEIMIEHLESVVKELAMERAMILKVNVMTEEEITKFINEKGEKYAKKYEQMSEVEIIFEKMMEIAKCMGEKEDGK